MDFDVIGKIEYPKNNMKIGRGPIIVQGWTFSKQTENLEILIYLDNKFVEISRWGLARYDIWEKNQENNSFESGFISKIKNVEEGTHTIRVDIKVDGKIHSLQEVKIETSKTRDIPNDFRGKILACGSKGAFKKLGKQYVRSFKEITNLHPDGKVLEIGCGMGRFAVALTKYLDSNGKYFGFDIVPYQIEYCQKNIEKRYSNFEFLIADICNKLYNKNGKYQASDYKFPFKDNTFDLIFLHSVFTHMILKDIQNYLKEISRMLKPGGYCCISYILLNKKDGVKHPRDNKFTKKIEGYFIRNEKMPESAIAYDENDIRTIYKDNKLQIIEPTSYAGSHDVIFARK